TESNMYHSSHTSEYHLLSCANEGSNKRQTVTTEWFTFVARCPDDVIRIIPVGAPSSQLVTGTCGTSYTRIPSGCKNHTPGVTYNYNLTFTSGQRYYLIMEGQNGITDSYDI